MHVFLIATLDTKGAEAAFVRERLVAEGVSVIVIDAGCQGAPSIDADVAREAVFAAAGASLQAARGKADRGEAVATAAQGAAIIVERGP